MHEQLALRLLRQIMNWDEETAAREYRWVRLMSRFKFDGYRDYLAGVRFGESLAGWLSQFRFQHRQAAYSFVKDRLVYFSPLEIQRLVEQLYPRFIEPCLRGAVATEAGIAPYLIWSDVNASRLFERKRRQVLLIGLSDGARIDMLRRANAGTLVNDQIVLMNGSRLHRHLLTAARRSDQVACGLPPRRNQHGGSIPTTTPDIRETPVAGILDFALRRAPASFHPDGATPRARGGEDTATS
jgi:hypothetical protein